VRPKSQEKERVKKKIKRWLRLKKREWCHERKKNENLQREKGKTNMSFYVQESEVKRAFLEDQPMSFIVYKESSLNLDETNQFLPSLAFSLLQESEDVFSKKMLSGLPPIRDIEHQIDFVLGAIISNRSAYTSNSEETKELQRQDGDFMSKGYVRENMSPCAVLVLLVP
jgi:hypothetical protein